jgi:ribosomal protein L17
MLHYRRNPKWDRKKLEELKNLTGLKVAQIYKWMWDTKKREEKIA